MQCITCDRAECYKWYSGPKCAPCYQATRKLNHREHVLKLNHESAKRCKPRINKYLAKYRIGYKKSQLNNYLKCKYGITLEQFEGKLKEQSGLCAICRRAGSGRTQSTRMVVDHNHTTGKFRGVLCHPCNAALGLFRDCPDILVKAAGYLRAA